MLQTKKLSLATITLAAVFMLSTPLAAEPKNKVATKTSSKTKVYTEEEFLRTIEGKSKKAILGILGAPVKKEQSVKPTGADMVLASKATTQGTSKKVNVEMWYYNDIVKYDPKRTYKETELTFVNDRCMNIAFFNNR